MDVAFYLLGRVPVYTFSLIIAIGSAVGLLWSAQKAKKREFQRVSSAGVWALIGAAIMGRAVFITVHWTYFQTHLLEIAQIWLGGISAYGAFFGGIISILLFAVISKNNFGELIDALTPLLTTLTFSAWLGCWINGYLYGPETQAWWGIPVRDEWGEYATRWPLQLCGALLALLIAWGVYQARGRGWLPSPGLTATLQVGCTALTLLWAAAMRVDPIPQWRNLGLDIWASLGLILLAITGTILFLHTNPTDQPTP